MTLVWIILTLVGLLALAAVVLHFLPKSSDVRIAKLEDDANWLWDRVFPSHAGVTAVAASAALPLALAPRPAVDPVVATPAVPFVPIVNTPHGCNGVPTPAGLTDVQFVQLVMAKQGAATLLNPKAGVLQAVITGSDGWFAQSLGAYWLRELIAQSTASTPVGDRIRAFVASANPTIEQVTPAQDAAAVLAAGVVTIGAPTS